MTLSVSLDACWVMGYVAEFSSFDLVVSTWGSFTKKNFLKKKLSLSVSKCFYFWFSHIVSIFLFIFCFFIFIITIIISLLYYFQMFLFCLFPCIVSYYFFYPFISWHLFIFLFYLVGMLSSYQQLSLHSQNIKLTQSKNYVAKVFFKSGVVTASF